jgi:hypothetical protein
MSIENPQEPILTPQDHQKLDEEERTIQRNVERDQLAALELSL